MKKQSENLKKYLSQEFRKIPHPFDPTDPDKIYQFENIETIVDAFLKLLTFDCSEERLQTIGPDFISAFEAFNNAKYTETDKSSSRYFKNFLYF